MNPLKMLSRIRSLLLAVLLAVPGGCGEGEDQAQHARDGKPVLEDGPLTDKARAQIALLTDDLEENDGEAYQTLRRIGRDAVPALVEALHGPHDEAFKQNALWMLGGLCFAADPAIPFLEEIQVTGPTWVAFAAGQAVQRIEESRTCGLPDLSKDAEVHVVGRYRGEKELDVQLGESGHTVTEIEVVVDRTDRPTVLVLTAYDPVVWKVGRAPGARLAAVLVSGHHTQALLGIPRSLPHKVISGEESVGCRPFHASGVEDLPAIRSDVMRLTGHGITRFHGTSPTGVFRVGGDPYHEPLKVTFSSDLSLDDYAVYRGEIPAGPRGVDELQRQGKIRPATREDIDAWLQGARWKDPDTVVHLHPGNVFVVLEAITLPPGLSGAHARTFIIPRGVPAPSGPKGHCRFFFMKDFTRG